MVKTVVVVCLIRCAPPAALTIGWPAAQARAEARARQGDRPALTDESIQQAVEESRFECSKAEQEEARGAAEAKWGRVADWDVSGVTSMEELFNDAREFSEDLGLWDVSACESMAYMFYGAAAFNGDVAAWDVSACEDMKRMFAGAAAFDAAKHAPWYNARAGGRRFGPKRE